MTPEDGGFMQATSTANEQAGEVSVFAIFLFICLQLCCMFTEITFQEYSLNKLQIKDNQTYSFHMKTTPALIEYLTLRESEWCNHKH